MVYDNRNYVIFDVSELNSIDFSQVLETSADTVRISVDGTKTFVKWNGDTPSSVLALTTKGEYLSHDQILQVLAGEEWTPLLQ